MRNFFLFLIIKLTQKQTKNFLLTNRQKRISTSSSRLVSSHPNMDSLNEPSVNNFNQIGPLNAFTLESVEILKEAQQRIEEGKDLRARSKLLMRDCIENAKNMGQLVNDSFFKKIEETLYQSVNILIKLEPLLLLVISNSYLPFSF